MAVHSKSFGMANYLSSFAEKLCLWRVWQKNFRYFGHSWQLWQLWLLIMSMLFKKCMLHLEGAKLSTQNNQPSTTPQAEAPDQFSFDHSCFRGTPARAYHFQEQDEPLWRVSRLFQRGGVSHLPGFSALSSLCLYTPMSMTLFVSWYFDVSFFQLAASQTRKVHVYHLRWSTLKACWIFTTGVLIHNWRDLSSKRWDEGFH